MDGFDSEREQLVASTSLQAAVEAFLRERFPDLPDGAHEMCCTAVRLAQRGDWGAACPGVMRSGGYPVFVWEVVARFDLAWAVRGPVAVIEVGPEATDEELEAAIRDALGIEDLGEVKRIDGKGLDA